MGIFLALSLVSFNPQDNSSYLHRASIKSVPLSNSAGIVGAYSAAWLLHGFGSAAFLLIPFFLLLGWLVFFGSEFFFFDWMHLAGIASLTFFWSLFTAQAGGDICYIGSPGGVVGAGGVRVLIATFDSVVLYGIIILLLCMGTVLLVRFAFLHALCCAGRWCWRSVGGASLKSFLFDPLAQSFRNTKIFLKNRLYTAGETCKSFVVRIAKKTEKEPDLDKNISGADALFEKFAKERMERGSDDVFDENFWLEIQKDLEIVLAKDGEAKEVHIPQKAPEQVDEEEVYCLPSSTLLQRPHDLLVNREQEKLVKARAIQLEEKLRLFGIEGQVLSTTVGPVVTLFEYAPAENVKISRIVGLEDDLALALGALSLRVIAPLPGRQAVGFEVANTAREMVNFSSCVSSTAFLQDKKWLPLVIGRDTQGIDVVVDLVQLPHLLVAGSTGSGKSVALHTMLLSLLYARTPDELRLVLVDPKRLEFAAYVDIPHLLIPVVTDVPRVPKVLSWLAQIMDERYQVLAQAGVRNVAELRAQKGVESMPSIVVVIDELADVMMVAKKEVEPGLARLAQMARAAGIHLIVATQRPSVDVLTGLVKVNFPARIAFKVASKIDSRTILDQPGAEKLLGKGDLLFLHPKGTCERMQGAFVHDSELQAVLTFIRKQRSAEYEVFDEIQGAGDADVVMSREEDPLLGEVERFVKSVNEVSISLIQRKFRIGYNRSARLIDLLEARGVILPAFGGKMRKVVKDTALS